MHLREIRIDKTSVIENALHDHLAICLSGLPGTGRKTAAVMLVESHPEINALYCDAEEIENRSVLSERADGRPNWYLVRKPEESRYSESPAGFRRFIQEMPREDRILFAVDGRIPDVFLEFIWSGIMAVILPEYLRFTEEETYRYLRACGSRLGGREVYHITGGWPGCVAMLVRLSAQLDDRWTVWELSRRYEIRKYIETQILTVLPEEELELLSERAPFPRLEEELEICLWGCSRREEEDRLFARGAMVFVPGKEYWYVHPALRIAMEIHAPEELCLRAVRWYEAEGYIQDALTCSLQSGYLNLYKECLLRNYDRISFLNYEKVWQEQDLSIPEFLYLEWLESVLRQDQGRLEMLRMQAAELWKASGGEHSSKKIREIFLNMAYTDLGISIEQWMDLVEKYVAEGEQIRLYHILGESVSFLSGLRELSPLFACGEEKERYYCQLWRRKLAPETQMPFRLARLEYGILNDTLSARPKLRSGTFLPYIEEAPWQIRLGSMYIAWLLLDDREMRDPAQRYIEQMVRPLCEEETSACRWNARALYYLGKAKCNEKAKLMEWMRDTGGAIEYDNGRTRFHGAAEVKISLYMGDYRRAEELLPELIDYFRNGNCWKWLAESLFQRAVTEYGKGMTGQAFQSVTESLETAAPYHYVRIYTGYGADGAELLEKYVELNHADQAMRTVRGAETENNIHEETRREWLSRIVAEAKKKEKESPVPGEAGKVYKTDKLTATELLVLQYLEKGYSNARISEEMNIRLSTVKSHIYNIYRKLEVSSRIQAVQKARESGLV